VGLGGHGPLDRAHEVVRQIRPRVAQVTPFASPVREYYLTNPIARASLVMAELAALRKSMKEGTTGTHG